jgi:hypothetical protein
MEKPYVISGELELKSNSQQMILNEDRLNSARESLTNDLEAMNKNVVWVSAGDMRRSMNTQLSTSRLPVVALDEVYTVSPDLRFGLSRGVDQDLNDSGYAARSGYEPITNQLDRVSSLGSEIQLVDDVVFSGEMTAWVVEQLERRKVKVGRVVCGIAIGEGVKRMGEMGISLESAFVFDEVEEEICERDLFMTRGSGRRVMNGGSNALYFDTKNGRPEQWASLDPAKADQFFRNSLERSEKLVMPDTPMAQVGRFLGYRSTGTAREAIRIRLEENENGK